MVSVSFFWWRNKAKEITGRIEENILQLAYILRGLFGPYILMWMFIYLEHEMASSICCDVDPSIHTKYRTIIEYWCLCAFFARTKRPVEFAHKIIATTARYFLCLYPSILCNIYKGCIGQAFVFLFVTKMCADMCVTPNILGYI